MATITLDMEDTLLERLTSMASERGENPSQLIVSMLQEALPVQTSPGDTAVLGEKTLALLHTFWEEQQTTPEKFSPPDQEGADAFENLLSRQWAEDIRTESMNR